MSIKHRAAAYRDLLQRYSAVTAHYWRQRSANQRPSFSFDEAQFLPAVLALQEAPLSPSARLTGRLLAALVGITLLWAILGQVDIVVNADGKVIPSGRIKSIASVDVASVRTLHVVEGQAVKAGDLLIELDTSASDAERDKAIASQAEAKLQAARAAALVKALDLGGAPTLPPLQTFRQYGISAQQWQAEQSHLSGIYRDFQARLQRVDGDIGRYIQELPLVTQRAHDYQALLQEHDVSQHAWLEKEQARIDLEGQLNDARHQRDALVAETRRTALDQYAEGEHTAAAATQDAIRSSSHSQLLQLKAPIDGTVQQLTVHTIGGVVPAAQTLMQIVPAEKALEIEAMVENKDIGFIRIGQHAEVKITAFDYSKYGTIPGRITNVAHDAINDEKRGLLYVARITLDHNSLIIDGSALPLTPGMTAQVELKTGERRLIEYLLSPLLQHRREALHER